MIIIITQFCDYSTLQIHMYNNSDPEQISVGNTTIFSLRESNPRSVVNRLSTAPNIMSINKRQLQLELIFTVRGKVHIGHKDCRKLYLI